jgi:dihydrofolate reductase
MGASLDGFIADRNGGFAWNAPSDDLFEFQLDYVRTLGCHLLGPHLYEAMRVWETDPVFRATDLFAKFADAWTALPKVVVSRTITSVEGNARLATGSVADEVARALASTDKGVAIGGATLAAEAIMLDLVDEYRVVRHPIIVGGGTPLLPPVAGDLRLTLIGQRTFDSRETFEHYVRER